MSYTKRKWITYNTQPQLLVVEFSKELKILGCWMSKFQYPRIGIEQLHIKFAEGTGELVRHLCSDSRCFNPCHVARGSWRENAKDETELQLFGIGIMRKLVGEEFSDVITNEEYLILQGKTSIINRCTTTEVAAYVREEFRRSKELALLPICESRLDHLQKILVSIVNNIEVKEVR
jgi:hypothetical protein